MSKVATGWTDCTGCNPKFVQPTVLRQRYNLPAQLTSVSPNNSVYVAEFQGQYYEDSDIASFSKACAITPPIKVARNVGKNEESAGVESELDVEYIGALTSPIPLTVYYQEEYSLLDWLKTVGSTENPGYVHSVSYGNDERQQGMHHVEMCVIKFNE